MKYIKSKKISKQKYELTLEVSEYDIEMFEDLALTYDPFQEYHDNKEKLGPDFELPSTYFTEKYQKWINKTWRTFWKLWKHHDD